MSTTTSIPDLIDQSRLSPLQWRIFGLCFLVALCDGFDTQAMAFTGPAILQAFNLKAAALAPILTAGIVGMVLGAMVFGLLADKFGRRPMVAWAVGVFAGATLATAWATSTDQILALRFIAGLGMGGATPIVLALTAEYCPANRRSTMMTSVILGLPAGAILGGLLASRILPHTGWQGIFIVGGLVPLVLLAVILASLPESLRFIARSKSEDANRRIEHIVRQIAPSMPAGGIYHVPEAEAPARVASLFSRRLGRNTAAIWLIYMFNWVAWFMFLSWFPTVLKATGFAPESAPLGTVVVNTMFVIFAIPLATILPKVNIRMLLLAMFLLGMAMCFALAHSGTNWTLVLALGAGAAIGIGGQQLVLNYVVAEVYPTALRATATGWAIGLGRVGAILGSASGGWFLEKGGPSGFYLALIAPLALAALGLVILRIGRERTEAAAEYQQ
ncbi:4-hydroxybenzoate transporter [Variovorax paradoxus]|uniref:MFS transporter n=1 Tax=Comamonadaceae TaxID=80864 RepID=UPI00056FB802|nr:MFS transporter [Xenophilus azovorans]KPU99422.1 4-hydroxybenzoate transporter [Variovorax paradoxus]MBN8746449.1 MFS transporter [Variovorax sp.]VTY38124.1 4-hydroxybenzoate transporter PcaK [Xylophilus ampelinus]KPV02152.1 4-hydroxybenzoate transporter [Variovorax paradoxus]KPV08699.1 4-hydroxybenzoate transporter [Variovorax paradoxus]